jgi:hypothetical protein
MAKHKDTWHLQASPLSYTVLFVDIDDALFVPQAGMLK